MQTALVAVIVVVAATQASVTVNPFSAERIQQINAHAKTWKAGRNFPENTSISYIKSLLGTKKLPKDVPDLEMKESVEDEDVPESFDARDHWPKCASIRQIRDQSECGACWAIATASTISDRICIHSNATKQISVSGKDLMCIIRDGCQGGYTLEAWEYWQTTGLVSGGEYGSGEGCIPYPFPQCARSDTTKYQRCPSEQYKPECSHECTNKDFTTPYLEDRHKGKKVYKINSDIKQIQLEIMKNGPAATEFEVFDDFVSYKSGVYQHTPGSSFIGNHAVKVIGWGVENDVPYWLISNSWNEYWGDHGLFKIIRGTNELNIDLNFRAGIPEL